MTRPPTLQCWRLAARGPPRARHKQACALMARPEITRAQWVAYREKVALAMTLRTRPQFAPILERCSEDIARLDAQEAAMADAARIVAQAFACVAWGFLQAIVAKILVDQV